MHAIARCQAEAHPESESNPKHTANTQIFLERSGLVRSMELPIVPIEPRPLSLFSDHMRPIDVSIPAVLSNPESEH